MRFRIQDLGDPLQKSIRIVSIVILLVFLLFTCVSAALPVTETADNSPISPTSTVNQIPSQITAGEMLIISGITTGHKNENVAVVLHPTTFAPASKDNSNVVTLSTKIDGSGVWSIFIDTSKLNPDDYVISVAVGRLSPVMTKIRINAGSSQIQTITPTVSSTVAPTVATQNTIQNPSTIQSTTGVSVSNSVFESIVLIIISALIVIIAGILILVLLKKRSKKVKKSVSKNTENQKEIHVHINGNIYSDVGVVASDNAIVNRPIVTNETVKKCPYCGAEIKNDAKFCSSCGNKLV